MVDSAPRQVYVYALQKRCRCRALSLLSPLFGFQFCIYRKTWSRSSWFVSARWRALLSLNMNPSSSIPSSRWIPTKDDVLRTSFILSQRHALEAVHCDDAAFIALKYLVIHGIATQHRPNLEGRLHQYCILLAVLLEKGNLCVAFTSAYQFRYKAVLCHCHLQHHSDKLGRVESQAT